MRCRRSRRWSLSRRRLLHGYKRLLNHSLSLGVNLSLGWESPAFGARIALNHKSPYLLEVGGQKLVLRKTWELPLRL